MIDNMSQKLGSQSGVSNHHTDISHGVHNLPSDDINELMHNNFNKYYLMQKREHDNNIKRLKSETYKRSKEVKHTHASNLLTQQQQALARKLDTFVDPCYEAVNKKPIAEPSEQASSTLPPLSSNRRQTKSVTAIKKPNKHLRQSLGIEYHVCKPKFSLLERMANEAPKSNASIPASSVALNSQTSRQAQELRA